MLEPPAYQRQLTGSEPVSGMNATKNSGVDMWTPQPQFIPWRRARLEWMMSAFRCLYVTPLFSSCVFHSRILAPFHVTGLLTSLSDLAWSSLVSIRIFGRAWMSLAALSGPALASTASIRQSSATG